MRVTTAFSRLLCLDGVTVRDVTFGKEKVVVEVALRRRWLRCPLCDYSTPNRHDRRIEQSVWRHLDLGVWRLELRATLRRLVCPKHGVRVEGVPFAGHGSRFTRDFEQLIAWLATRTDKSAISRMSRIAWRTVGAIIERVANEKLDTDRLDELFEVGIDEVSWRKGHRYLTLITDHRTKTIVWGAEGKSEATADKFYEELGPERAEALEAVSLDMGAAYANSTRKNAPQAQITIDPFHVVKLATEALDEVRRACWNELRTLDDQDEARKFKDARWALLKNPDNLTEKQTATLQKLKKAGGNTARAYTLKEALRGIFAPELKHADVEELINRFCQHAARNRLPAFIRIGRTIRKHRDGILAAVRLGINNARTEALNNKVRLITRRAYGFHTPQAALALIHLTCGTINLTLPHENP